MMRCDDVRCECPQHISPTTHVPACPNHGVPLIWAENGYGKCPAVTTTRNPAQLQETVKRECVEWGPQNWRWMPRELFNLDDLPPHNGFRPPEYRDEVQRIDAVIPCPDCGIDTPHAEAVTADGKRIVVCGRCEVGRWA